MVSTETVDYRLRTHEVFEVWLIPKFNTNIFLLILTIFVCALILLLLCVCVCVCVCEVIKILLY